MGLFSKIAEGLKKTKDSFLGGLQRVFNSFTKIDEELFEELEEQMIMSDIGVETSDIVLVDASGVSRNDLLSTDWMSGALYKINKNDKTFNYKEIFNIPKEIMPLAILRPISRKCFNCNRHRYYEKFWS